MKTNSIIVNGKEILILTEANEKFVAIKPICEAIGVNYETQKDKILSDEILGSVTPLRGATGADGKEYKMRVIPFRKMSLKQMKSTNEFRSLKPQYQMLQDA